MSLPTASSSCEASEQGPVRTEDLAASLLSALPAIDAEVPCHTSADPDLWFAEAPAQLEQAKKLCAECPVRAECLAGAVARREPWGVWGGEIFDRGAVVSRKRPRGRPRKSEVAAQQDEQQTVADGHGSGDTREEAA